MYLVLTDLQAHTLKVERQRDIDQARHEAFVERLQNLTPEEAFQLAVDAGIYTPDGKLTPPYQADAPAQVEQRAKS